MKELDLHGVKHSEVPKLLDSFVYDNNDISEFNIITGNSEKMKNLVTSLLDSYDYNYKIGGFLNINNGYIKVY